MNFDQIKEFSGGGDGDGVSVSAAAERKALRRETGGAFFAVIRPGRYVKRVEFGVFVCTILCPMSTVTFDTLEATRRLRDAGFDEKQVEMVVRVLSDAQSNLVTREHFDARFTMVEAKMDKLSWMIGALIAIAVANFAKQFF